MAANTCLQAPFPLSSSINKDCLPPNGQPKCQCCANDRPPSASTTEHLPGDPTISLDAVEVDRHLSAQLSTPIIDELYENMWLVARRAGDNIDALHVHNIKGRAILPSEDPKLHLVWDRSKIHIKPIPSCLLNHDFWTMYLRPRASRNNQTHPTAPQGFQRAIAIGFLRSYSRLVPQQVDFRIAQESHLIPSDIDWVTWAKFIRHFRHIGDGEVARRYHYGQLRLSRLHWAVRLFNPNHVRTRWFYELPYWSTTHFLVRATLPFIFLFASLSVGLSSMQVALAVPVEMLWDIGSGEHGLEKMGRIFWVISIVVFVIWAVSSFLFCVIPLGGMIRELQWGYKHRHD